ncbi:hypothetical protein EVA_03662, partial [gut metagenome]
FYTVVMEFSRSGNCFYTVVIELSRSGKDSDMLV